jgi:hypothetical protein
MEGVSRRRLLGSAGMVAGTVVIPAAAAEALERGEVTDPSGPPPEEAVVAIVRDADRGEVTLMSGTREVTLRDRALVRRLLKAAPKSEE